MMDQENRNVDDLLDDLIAEFGTKSTEEPEHTNNPQDNSVTSPDEYVTKDEKESCPEEQPKKERTEKRSAWKVVLNVLGKVMLFLLETVLIVAVGLYGVMYVLAKGPSPTARDLFVLSVRETSAVGFLANLFFTNEEIALIESGGGSDTVEELENTDTSLITITKPSEPSGDEQEGPYTDAYGYVDEDGDGIIVVPVSGAGYTGYMMIVLDPSRIIMGTVPGSYGGRGYTVAEMVQKFDAVAGVNAGGFEDEGGNGDGSTPSTLTVYDGKIYYAEKGIQDGFAGFDSNHILHVGKFTVQEIRDRDIQFGVSFGPPLVINGQGCDRSKLASGINPRTAIGQRADGAVLLLVIDGRQTISLGCTWIDMIDIFLEFGAVNASNLDGGSSTLMWYQGKYINNCASVVGIRPVCTTFLVAKEGVNND